MPLVLMSAIAVQESVNATEPLTTQSETSLVLALVVLKNTELLVKTRTCKLATKAET